MAKREIAWVRRIRIVESPSFLVTVQQRVLEFRQTLVTVFNYLSLSSLAAIVTPLDPRYTDETAKIVHYADKIYVPELDILAQDAHLIWAELQQKKPALMREGKFNQQQIDSLELFLCTISKLKKDLKGAPIFFNAEGKFIRQSANIVHIYNNDETHRHFRDLCCNLYTMLSKAGITLPDEITKDKVWDYIAASSLPGFAYKVDSANYDYQNIHFWENIIKFLCLPMGLLVAIGTTALTTLFLILPADLTPLNTGLSILTLFLCDAVYGLHNFKQSLNFLAKKIINFDKIKYKGHGKITIESAISGIVKTVLVIASVAMRGVLDFTSAYGLAWTHLYPVVKDIKILNAAMMYFIAFFAGVAFLDVFITRFGVIAMYLGFGIYDVKVDLCRGHKIHDRLNLAACAHTLRGINQLQELPLIDALSGINVYTPSYNSVIEENSILGSVVVRPNLR